MKKNIEIVAGFLGSGKTIFINGLIENAITEEKVLVIQCEKGVQAILKDQKKNYNIIIEEHDPQSMLTVQNLREYTEKHKPDRIIIEHNSCRSLEALLCSLQDKELSKMWRIASIYTILDLATYQIFISNLGAIILEPLYYSNWVILKNRERIERKKLENIMKELEEINPSSSKVYLSNRAELGTFLKENTVSNNERTQKISALIKKLIFNVK